MTRKILVYIVDDDSSARKGLTRLVRAAGYEVLDFASADEFLEACGTEASGCMILDARMPGLSGEELQKKLSESNADIPIIVVTADNDPETKRKAEAMGAAGFFTKPVDGKALLDAIGWALRSGLDGK
jgi:FixJ family two-component response regulator